MRMGGRFCTLSRARKFPHRFSLFRVYQVVPPQGLEETSPRPSLVVSNKSLSARRYEASEMTIMMWTLTLSCLPERRI